MAVSRLTVQRAERVKSEAREAGLDDDTVDAVIDMVIGSITDAVPDHEFEKFLQQTITAYANA